MFVSEVFGVHQVQLLGVTVAANPFRPVTALFQLDDNLDSSISIISPQHSRFLVEYMKQVSRFFVQHQLISTLLITNMVLAACLPTTHTMSAFII